MPGMSKRPQRWPRFREIMIMCSLVSGSLVVAACELRRALTSVDDVAQMDLSPSAVTVQPNETVDFTAVAFTAASDTAEMTVTWSATGGSITSQGRQGGRHLGQYRNGACGAFQVTATSQPGNKADTAAVSVACPGGVVFVGAGDIAGCSSSGDEATAALLDGIPGTVFTAGDNVYESGTASEFANCYDPSWGRHKAQTRPSPGNHDYNTSGATGYYNYFGANAGPSGRGYYSYDLGDWHLISLNSNISMSAGSTQEQWLRADLAANPKRCVLAYWHHPRFSSGSHGSSTSPQPLWQALYDYDADVVIVGHDHNYQRFAPQTPTGVADPARGIRQFLAGMGGRSHYTFSTPIVNTEAYNTDTDGVLKLTLSADSYTWEFIPVAGKAYTDSGSASCH